MTSRSSVRAGGQGPPEGDPDLDLDPDPGTGKGRDRGQGTERGRGRGTEKGPDAAAGDQDPQGKKIRKKALPKTQFPS